MPPLEADLARLTRQHLELDSRIEIVLTDAIKKGQDMYNNGYKNQIAQWEKARSEAMRHSHASRPGSWVRNYPSRVALAHGIGGCSNAK